MLQPKKTKFRKQHKMLAKGNATRGTTLAFGSFGTKSLETGWLPGKQIEAARVAVTRYMKRDGQIWCRIFPDKPITKKPQEVRMGKGKGSVEYWVAQVRPGTMLYEIQGVSEELAREAFTLAAAKLPLKTLFTVRTIM